MRLCMFRLRAGPPGEWPGRVEGDEAVPAEWYEFPAFYVTNPGGTAARAGRAGELMWRTRRAWMS
jgi:hypothetical protein